MSNSKNLKSIARGCTIHQKNKTLETVTIQNEENLDFILKVEKYKNMENLQKRQ